MAPDKLCRAAIDEAGALLGWVGGIPAMMATCGSCTRWWWGPIGRARASAGRWWPTWKRKWAARGGLTLWLGTDDEDDMTSLAGVDLYHDLPGRLAAIRNLKRHPFEFYRKCGFVIVGVVPDANGPGKPDILMAKRVEPG